MSVATEITRIRTAIAAAYSACEAKGATMPAAANRNVANLASTIASIPYTPTPTNPYVSDGLIAWWDGVWNAGLGVHDDDAVVWKDLVGNRDLVLAQTGVSWTDVALHSENTTEAAARYSAGVPEGTVYTAEFCKGTTTNGNGTTGGQGTALVVTSETPGSATKGIFIANANSTANWIAVGFRLSEGEYLNRMNDIQVYPSGSYSFIWSDPGAIPESGFVNGIKKTSFAKNTSIVGSGSMGGIGVFGRTGVSSGANNTMIGDCYCIRLYNRKLTDAEVAANYAVDRQRFGV